MKNYYLKVVSTTSKPLERFVLQRTWFNDNLLMLFEDVFTLTILYPHLHVLSSCLQLAITTEPILFNITATSWPRSTHLVIPQQLRAVAPGLLRAWYWAAQPLIITYANRPVMTRSAAGSPNHSALLITRYRQLSGTNCLSHGLPVAQLLHRLVSALLLRVRVTPSSPCGPR